MATQTYMTAKLNLADGTIVYPQISLDNIVKSISDPTLVTVAQLDANSKVSISNLPVTTSVTNSNSTVPTNGAVYGALNTKQATLVEGDNIIHIINGSTIMADITNLDVAAIDTTTVDNGVHLTLSGGNTVGVAAMIAGATTGVPGVLAGASDGVKLVNGVAQFDVVTAPAANGETAGLIKTVGDGLLVDGGTAHIDEATVKTTLQDVRIDNGSTVSPVDDQVVTPGNLRGALSVSQSVDVSCKALDAGWQEIAYEVDSETHTFSEYYATTSDAFTQDTRKFLGTFRLRSTAAQQYYRFGFGTSSATSTTRLFPKKAPNLKYLAICDIRNCSATQAWGIYTDLEAHGSTYPNTNKVPGGIPSSLISAATAAAGSQYERLAILFSGDQGRVELAVQGGGVSGTFEVEIKNWRQYEVTALTDEAIAYIAQLPDPDAFFRAASVYSLRDKYLVKQDMVCPWIFTIPMGDNSDLTVGAGLSYKIKYTNDKPHSVTVDTIPADAYGWDSHIQMFVKGASSVQFQYPMVLMNPLTSNAGNNLVVKFRNGQALVYVEDTNVGYVVVDATGSSNGTLAYGFTYTPSVSTDDKYIIFGTVTDDLVCDFGTVSAVYGADSAVINVIGNGMDKTTITGDLTIASNKRVNFQDLTITGTTINGSTYQDKVELDNVTFGSGVVEFANVVVPEGSTVNQTGTSSLAGTYVNISGSGTVNFRPRVSGTYSPTLYGTIQGVTFTCGSDSVYNSSFYVRYNQEFVLDGVTGYAPYRVIGMDTNSSLVVKNGSHLVADGGGTYGVIGFFGGNNTIQVIDSCIDNSNSGTCIGFYQPTNAALCTLVVRGSTIGRVYVGDKRLGGSKIILGGTNSLRGHLGGYTSSIGEVIIEPDTVLDVTERDSSDTDATTYIIAGSFQNTTFGDNVSIVKGDTVLTIDACTGVRTIWYEKLAISAAETDGIIKLIGDNVEPWKVSNARLYGDIDASDVYTMRISGATFGQRTASTAPGVIKWEPCRINLPANSSNYLTMESTTAADTKVLKAPIIIVGDVTDDHTDGSSTSVVTATGTTTYTGLGTYVCKDGSSDIAAGQITAISTTEGGATGLTAALTGDKTFVKVYDDLVTGSTATNTSSSSQLNVTKKHIITKRLEPMVGGNFNLSAGTSIIANASTKTIEVAGEIRNFNGYLGKGMTLIHPADADIVVYRLYGGGSWGHQTLTGDHRISLAANASVKGMTFEDIEWSSSITSRIYAFTQASTAGEAVIEDCVFRNLNKMQSSNMYGVVGFYQDCSITFKNCIFENIQTNSQYKNTVIQMHSSGVFKYYNCTVRNCYSDYALQLSTSIGYSTFVLSGGTFGAPITGNYSNAKLSGNISFTANPALEYSPGYITMGSRMFADIAADTVIDCSQMPSATRSVIVANSDTYAKVFVPDGVTVITPEGNKVTVAPGVYPSISTYGVVDTAYAAYKVTTATGTGTGTLDYIFQNTSAAKSVVFSHDLDGSTVTLPADTVVQSFGADSPIYFVGNGPDKTILNLGNPTPAVTTGGHDRVIYGSVCGVKITGTTVDNYNLINMNRTGLRVDNCIFSDNITYNVSRLIAASTDQSVVVVSDCQFLNNRTGGSYNGCVNAVSLGAVLNVVRCRFEGTHDASNNAGVAAGVIFGGRINLYGCTFVTAKDKIVLYNNTQGNYLYVGYASRIYNVVNQEHSTVEFGGSGPAYLTGTITGAGTTTFGNNCIFYLNENNNEYPISGGTITVPAGVKFTLVPRTGSNRTLKGPLVGTYIKNTGDNDLVAPV